MNRTKTLLTFLVVALLAISLPITVYILKTGNLDFRISAFESDEPVQSSVTDISGSSFRVTWITERPVYGAVKLSSNIEPVTESNSSSYHTLLVQNLNPGSSYTFQLLSDGKSFDKTYSVITATQTYVIANHWILGQVFSKDGVSTQNGGIILLQLKRSGQTSQILSTTINESGGFKFNLGTLLTADNSQIFPIQGSSDLSLTVATQAGLDPVVKTYTMDLSNEVQIPNIYLGDINIQVIPGVAGN